MSESVLITLIICLTAIFIGLILAVSIRWVCVVIVSNKARQPIVDEKYLTVDEFEEFEHTIIDAVHKLEDKLDKRDDGD